MPNVGIRELISMTNPELVTLGVPSHEVTDFRERMTGHSRSLSAPWARTVGHWGGVSTKREIAEVAECDVATAKSYATRMRLRTRTIQREMTPVELAVLCLVHMPKPAREVAPFLGIMRVEVVLYRAAMTVLCELNGVTLPQVLRWTCDELEAAWAADRLSIALDAEDYVNYRDLDSIAAIAVEAEAQMRAEGATARAAKKTEGRLTQER